MSLRWLFSKNPKKKYIDYQRDRALSKKSEDKFKHSHYVDVLKDVLRKCETPINVGLYGRWGVGKSSVLHMLKEDLEKGSLAAKFKYVEVDAWGLSAESIQADILMELNSQLKTFPPDKLNDLLFNTKVVERANFKNFLFRYWPFIAGAIGVPIAILYFFPEIKSDLVKVLATFGISSMIAGLLSFIKFMIGTSQMIISKPVAPFHFHQIYKVMVKKEKKTLVIAIDNLDRCDDKIAVDLLGIIQTFMTKENCINILVCDDEAIVNHLRRVKGESYTEREGNEFLSKFFQVTIRIPPFIAENLDSYAQELMNQRSITFDPFVKQILISGAIENPRKINQFLNNVVAMYRLAEMKERDKKLPMGSITSRTDVLTKIIVIRHEWPDFYKALQSEPDLLNNSQERQQWMTEFISESKSSPKHFVSLEYFLNATQFCSVEDIIPFLRLNQPSYQAEIPQIEKFEIDVNNNNFDDVLKTFEGLDDHQKEQHIQKIKSLNRKHASEGTIPTLMNSTIVLMGIIEATKNSTLRKIALADLGTHLSSDTLSPYFEKYDLEKIFRLTEEMVPVFKNPIYSHLQNLIVTSTEKEVKFNAKLAGLFIKNANVIPYQAIKNADETLTNQFDSNEQVILDMITDTSNSKETDENPLSKFPKMLTHIISKFTLDNSEANNNRLEVYGKIRGTLNVLAKGIFINHLTKLIPTSAEPEKLALIDKFVEIINNFIINDLEDLKPYLPKLYDSMLGFIDISPDLEKNKTIFEILFQIANKVKEN